MPDTPERLRAAARDAFGWTDWRPGQLPAMTALVEGRDALVVMPTGAGKSAIYQVPGLLIDGPTLVVSPLIALQRDQMTNLLSYGDEDAQAVAANSQLSAGERREAFDRVRAGDVEYLFLSPEQLANPSVLDDVRRLRPSLIAVDEAHCVSAWGHDFRPDYLRLGDAIAALGHPPVVALTATASPPVRDEIVERLGLRDVELVVEGFERPNLELAVQDGFRGDDEKRAAVVTAVLTEPKPGIVYCATRKDTEGYAGALSELGLTVAPYHAGMKAADRSDVQRRFTDGELDVVVATNAFGMGIDKPDVRFVVHASVPESLDSYYQEVGRAGRDGEPARGVLFYRPEDLGLRRFFASGRPDEDALRKVLGAADGVSVAELRRRTGLGPQKAANLLNLLERVGAAVVHRHRWTATDLPAAEAVKAALDAADARTAIEKSRVEMLRGYAETRGCRWQFVLGYFGEGRDEPCGHCDRCLAGDASVVDAAPADAPFAVQSRVRHGEWGEGMVMAYDGEQVTVLFDSVGYKTLLLPAVEAQGLLSPA